MKHSLILISGLNVGGGVSDTSCVYAHGIVGATHYSRVLSALLTLETE